MYFFHKMMFYTELSQKQKQKKKRKRQNEITKKIEIIKKKQTNCLCCRISQKL